MEKSNLIELLIVQILFVFLIIFIIITIIKIRHNVKLEKKFSKYTLKKVEIEKDSLFDKINLLIKIIIKSLSKLLQKSFILKNYSKKFERHIRFEEIETKSGIDYLSIKLLLGIVILVLYIFTAIFQFETISLIGIVVTFLIGFYSLDIFLKIKYLKIKKEISDDLLSAIVIMNNAFKSGMSIIQAIELVKDELHGSIGDEFKKIHMDMMYGLSIEIVFERFYERVKLDDAKYITTSLTLLNKTGGNIVKVFASVEREFFNKKKLKNELKTLTSSSIFVFRILLFLPFVLAFLIIILNTNYFTPLITTKLGIIILSAVCILYILYVIVMKKIMRIDM